MGDFFIRMGGRPTSSTLSLVRLLLDTGVIIVRCIGHPELPTGFMYHMLSQCEIVFFTVLLRLPMILNCPMTVITLSL